uniref:UBX domain-containing protein 11 n=1 Tax=Anser brachyrhynchus TaxID=132585 RepID=A0A8B9B9F9_9AVES
ARAFLLQRFLNDYGLIWVGERHEQLEGLQSLKDEDLPAKSLWKPGKASRLFAEATILAPLDLNMLAGEGISQIEHTPQGARLRQQEPLPLTLYQNGIVMFDGPFRSYEEPSAQQCLQDIMDGYFPSELQMRYPDGIPFQVRIYSDGESSKGLYTHTHLPSALAGPKPSSKQFLNKLSKSSVPGGEAINIRDSVRATQGFLTSRLKRTEEAGAPAPEICTLRIKSESGEQTYTVRMLFTETIGELRQHLARARGGDSSSYEIISTFPKRVYADNSRSLQECGLIPRASLLLRRRDPLPREGQGCTQRNSS